MRKIFGISLTLLGLAGMSQLFGSPCLTALPVIRNLAFLQMNCGVPEINPSTAASALALLSGGLLLLRRRAKK